MSLANLCERIPARFVIALMLGFACVLSSVLEASFPIALLAMARKSVYDTDTMGAATSYGVQYIWEPYEQYFLLAAFYVGKSLVSLPVCCLIEKYRIAKSLVFYVFGLSACLDFLGPAVIEVSLYTFLGLRVIMGSMQGAIIVAIFKLSTSWVLPDEMDRFALILLGSNAGMLIGAPLLGCIIDRLGWKSAFYLPGIMNAVFAICWLFLIFDGPHNHPRISQTERMHVQTKLARPARPANKIFPSMRKMCASPPFWALLLLQYGDAYGFNFMLTGVPIFLHKVLGFPLVTSACLLGIPYGARLVFGTLFGLVSHYLSTNEGFSRSSLRKGFCVFSHIIPGLLLIALPVCEHLPIACILCIVLSFGLNGSVVSTGYANMAEVAPCFITSLAAMIGTVVNTSGLIAPFVVTQFTGGQITMDAWKPVFWIGAAMYALPGTVFVLLGSARIQTWNASPDRTPPRPLPRRSSSVNTDSFY